MEKEKLEINIDELAINVIEATINFVNDLDYEDLVCYIESYGIDLDKKDKEIYKDLGMKKSNKFFELVSRKVSKNNLSLTDIILGIQLENLEEIKQKDYISIFSIIKGFNEKYKNLLSDIISKFLIEANYAEIISFCKNYHRFCKEDIIFDYLFQINFPDYYEKYGKQIIKMMFLGVADGTLYWKHIYIDFLKMKESYNYLFDVFEKGKYRGKNKKFQKDVQDILYASLIFTYNNPKMIELMIKTSNYNIVDLLNISESKQLSLIKEGVNSKNFYTFTYILENIKLSENKKKNIVEKLLKDNNYLYLSPLYYGTSENSLSDETRKRIRKKAKKNNALEDLKTWA